MPDSYGQLLKHTLLSASVEGQVVVVQCRQCGRRVHYLAADLIEVRGVMHSTWTPPFPCARCNSEDLIDVKLLDRATATARGLVIRRPVPHRHGWRWRNVALADR